MKLFFQEHFFIKVQTALPDKINNSGQKTTQI